LRRTAIEQLMTLRLSHAARPTYRVIDDALARLAPQPTPVAPAQVHVLVRTPEQLEATLALRPASITLDSLEFYGLKPSVERVQATGRRRQASSPRMP